jgi:hypothetical protein
MTTVGLIVDLLGFDPTRLASRPTGYAMLYWGGLSFALATSSMLVFATPLRWAGRLRWLCVAGAIGGLIGVTVLQQALFVEYPGQETVAPDTGIKEAYIVPVPMPGLRSADFDRNWSVGSPNYKNASPAEYAAQGSRPENFAATWASVLAHWLALMLFLACFFAMSALAIKALISAAMQALRSR